MLPRHQQTQKTPEGAHKPNRMPYRDRHQSQAGKQGDQRERIGRKDRESWFCLSCIHYNHRSEQITIDVVPPCQVSLTRSSG